MKKLLWGVSVLIIIFPLLSRAQTCGTTNIALGKPVVVSNEFEWRPGQGAVDGNVTDGWHTLVVDSAYIYLDLGISYTICKTKLYWGGDGRGKDYQLQTSTDAINWTTIATRTDNSAVVDSFQASGTGRFVRLYMTSKVVSWSGYQLYEIQIFNNLSNAKPSVVLTAPANNYKTFSGNNVKLTATATDSDGSISKVEFYQDSTKVGESTTAPFAFTLYNVQPGSFVLKAKAFDNTNADSMSAPITITVAPANRWGTSGNAGTVPDSNFIGTTDNKKLVFKVNNSKKLIIQPNGFVGIGVESIADSTAKLGVEGTIYARRIKITQDSWADYVFDDNYALMSLPNLAAFIRQHRHLPDMPTTSEVTMQGTDIAQIQELLLRKVEELTLYVLNQSAELKMQQQKMRLLEKQVKHSRK